MLRKLLSVIALLPGAAFAQATELADGIPRKGLEGIGGGPPQTFYLTVPAGTTDLRFVLTQGSGSATMWVDDGGGGDPECTSSSEPCEFTDPNPGNWQVNLLTANGYSGASLTGWSLTALQRNDVVTGIDGDENSYRWFYLNVPFGIDSLAASTSGGTGNADLAVISAASWNAILNQSGGTFCLSDNAGNIESCERNNPQSGLWLVQLFGKAAYTDVTLEVDYEEGDSGGAPSPLLLGGLLLTALARRVRRRPAPAP